MGDIGLIHRYTHAEFSLETRDVDRERLSEGLRRAGPKAVDDSRQTFG